MTFKVLDLFCGAGGAAMGYHQALDELGIEHTITGVDHKPMPRYPFEFIQADALEYCEAHGRKYDFIHASPPCQRYSSACKAAHTEHLFPDLLPNTRKKIKRTKRPFVIENVPGAPMRADIILCGSNFNLPIVRHRLFETKPRLFVLVAPCNHVDAPIGIYGHGTNSWYRRKTGRNASTDDWRDAMQAHWMSKAELAEAIPPAYTRWIGLQIFPRIVEAAPCFRDPTAPATGRGAGSATM